MSTRETEPRTPPQDAGCRAVRDALEDLGIDASPRASTQRGDPFRIRGDLVHPEANPEAVSLEPTACLNSLPLELIGHVALWLHSLTDLAQLQCVDRQCRDGSSARTAQLSQLLGHFPRLQHILRHAARESLCPRPLDLDAILAQQQAADNGEQRVAGVLQEMPHAEQLDLALLLTVEMRYMAEFALWSGSPKHAYFADGPQNAMGPTYRPRLWTERPKWINELNRLNEVDPETADRGWAAIHVRAFLTCGVHTVKILDAVDGEGGGQLTGWHGFDGSRDAMSWACEPPFGYVGVGRDEETFDITFFMSDDGYFELEFFTNHTAQYFSWSNVRGLFNNVWPFTTATEVDAVKGVGWWERFG